MAAIALGLRAQRARADLTYTELSKITGISKSTLARAASGDSLPQLNVVETFAEACGATRKEIREYRVLWRSARRVARPRRSEEWVHTDLIASPRDLWLAMDHLYSKIGRPSLRAMEQRAGGHGRLPRSTLSMVLRGKATPSRDLLNAFLKACDVPASGVERWMEAWDRMNKPTYLAEVLAARTDMTVRKVGRVGGDLVITVGAASRAPEAPRSAGDFWVPVGPWS